MLTERELQEHRLRLLQELNRRANMPMNCYTPDTDPSRNQLLFHTSTARTKLAKGGNRSGKSTSTSYEAAAWARDCHRFRDLPPGPKTVYVISSEYRTIFQGIYRHLAYDEPGMKFLDKSWIRKKGPKIPGAAVDLPSYIQVYTERDENGNKVNPEQEDRPYSTIYFISGDGREQARRKMQAAAVDLVIIDEEVDEEIYNELLMRLLDNDGELYISATLIRSEEWVMKLEDRFNDGDDTVLVITLDTSTSTHLSERAKTDIFKNLSEEEYAVRVLGNSRRSFGLVYPEFDNKHTFNKAEEFPDGFSDDFILLRANDPGWKTHAVLWAALDTYTSTAYIYRELYCTNTPLHEVCKQICHEEGYDLVPTTSTNSGDQGVTSYGIPHIKIAIPGSNQEDLELALIDPAALRKNEAGYMGIAHQMAAYYECPVAPAMNEVQSGIMAVKRLLEINPNTGRPHLMFDVSLTNLFRERRKYRYKKDTSGSNSNEMAAQPVKKDDHAMDTMRYLCSHIFTLFSGEQLGKNNNYNNGISSERMQQLYEKENRIARSRRPSKITNSFVGNIF